MDGKPHTRLEGSRKVELIRSRAPKTKVLCGITTGKTLKELSLELTEFS